MGQRFDGKPTEPRVVTVRLHGESLFDWLENRDQLVFTIVNETIYLLEDLNGYHKELQNRIQRSTVEQRLEESRVGDGEAKFVDIAKLEKRFLELKRKLIKRAAPLGEPDQRERLKREYLRRLVRLIENKSATLIKMGDNDPVIAIICEDARELIELFQPIS